MNWANSSGDNGHIAEAHQAFEAAAKAEPRWPEPYLRLSLMAVESHNWKEVADTTDRVLRLNSFEYPQAFFLKTGGPRAEPPARGGGREKRALGGEARRGHQIPQIADLLGTILAERHQYAEAAEKYRAYLLLAPDASDAPAARKQLEAMETLAAGKCLAGGGQRDRAVDRNAGAYSKRFQGFVAVNAA